MTLWLPGMKITADRLNGVIMDWTELSSLGSYGAGFTAGTFVPRMRKIHWAGTEVWELEGDINAPSITIAATHNMFTFDSAHRVATIRLFPAGGNSTSFNLFWVQISSTGALNAGLATGSSSSATTRLSLAGIRITNPDT